MDIKEILTELAEKNASDVFIVAGRPLSYKANEIIECYPSEPLKPADTRELIECVYGMAGNRDINKVMESGDDDFAFAIPGVSRYRASIYKQRGSLSAVIRVIAFRLPTPEKYHIPPEVMSLAGLKKGLVLVTGPSGSGKSTTLACLIDYINSHRSAHIITLEDPIEYLHPHKKSIVSQREIALDTCNYLTALRASLRQTPDVILIGELRDPETINIAMTAAETGHLIISTLHTLGAANTIDRIVDSFEAEKQAQIRLQLSMVLQAVVSQQLVIAGDGSLRPVFEIMKANPAIRTMIRESKTYQIESVIYSGAEEGMICMDNSLVGLCGEGVISAEEAVSHSFNPEAITKKLQHLQ